MSKATFEDVFPSPKSRQDHIDDFKEEVRKLIDETFSATDEKAYELWKKIEQL